MESRWLHNTAEAKFLSNIAGSVVFRQLENDSDADTSVRVNLFKTQEVNPFAENVYWFLLSNPNSEQHKVTMTSECRLPLPFPPSLTQLYILARKFGRLRVGRVKDDATSTFVETGLPLSGVRSIIGNILVLARGSGEIVSCAFVGDIEPRQAVSSIFNDGVKGKFEFIFHSLQSKKKTYFA